MDERDQTILKLLGKSVKTGLSTSAVAARARLASLVERGLVVEIGQGPNDPHRRYHLVADSPRGRM